MKLSFQLFLAVSAAACAQAQGTFQNLDFESANLPTIPAGQTGYFVPASSGLPSWTVYLGNEPVQQVMHNNYSYGTASINILGPDFGTMILDGRYSVMLQAGGLLGSPNVTVDASIAQNGTVPVDAQILLFKAWGTTHYSVSFDGHILNPYLLEGNPSFNLYAADVSSYSGQNGELKFTSQFNSTGPLNLGLDSISFSAIPEPSTMGLVLFGFAVLGLWRHFRPSK